MKTIIYKAFILLAAVTAYGYTSAADAFTPADSVQVTPTTQVAQDATSTTTAVTPGQVLDNLLSKVKFTGYAHAGYEYDDTDPTTSTFNIKRAILWCDAKITDRWSMRFMYNFCSDVQDFYTDFRITNGPELSVRVGQFKTIFTIENPLSPSTIECINGTSQAVTAMCGVKNDPLFGSKSGRDLGMKFFGDLFNKKFHYEFAIMNGQGINCSDGNSDKDILLKLEFRPISGLNIVTSGQKGRGHAVGTADWNPDIAIGDNYRRDRLSFGAEWKGTPFSLRGEWLAGRDGEVDSRGLYFTGLVTVAKDIDIIASYDFYDRNIDLEYNQTNITAGVQYWFFKKCRVQLQYTRVIRQFDEDYNCIQAQFQVGF